MVSYLANTVRTQLELSNRLATAQLTLGGGESGAGAGERGQRGGKGRGGQQKNTDDDRA